MNMPLSSPAVIDQLTEAKEHQGWQASLNLEFTGIKSGTTCKTILKKNYHYGPLRIQRPFYPDQDVAHVYMLHPPGGVVGGDQLDIQILAHNNAHLLVTTPGSGKFYLSAGDWANYSQRLQIKPGSTLEWFPQENILFSGARVNSIISIELEDDAQFIGWDINCFGRPASCERFDHGAFTSRLELYHNQTLLLIENQYINNSAQLEASAGLRHYPVQACMIAYPCDTSHYEAIQKILSQQDIVGEIAATLMDNILIIRSLSHSSEQIKLQFIKLWACLRPLMLRRFAVAPRIWST